MQCSQTVRHGVHNTRSKSFKEYENFQGRRGLKNNTDLERVPLGSGTTVCRYSGRIFRMFKCRWPWCSCRTQSYLTLKRHEPRWSRNSVAKTSTAKASSSTSSAAMNLQGAAERTEGEDVQRDVSVDGHAMLSELGFANNLRKGARQLFD